MLRWCQSFTLRLSPTLSQLEVPENMLAIAAGGRLEKEDLLVSLNIPMTLQR